jgi:hypothetical protein
MSDDTTLYLVRWDEILKDGSLISDVLSLFENRDEALELAQAKAGRIYQIYDAHPGWDFTDKRCRARYLTNYSSNVEVRCSRDYGHVGTHVSLEAPDVWAWHGHLPSVASTGLITEAVLEKYRREDSPF